MTAVNRLGELTLPDAITSIEHLADRRSAPGFHIRSRFAVFKARAKQGGQDRIAWSSRHAADGLE